jgi:hypothetical protein
MPKYVAPNLRGPKLVWVPSKSGWLFVGTIGIEGLVQLNSCYSSYVESSNEDYCIYHPNAKSKQVKSKVLQHTSATFKIVVIYWNYLMACKYLN